MCLLTFFPDGQRPDVDCLLNGAVVNDDGHGYAIAHGGQLIVGRHMDAAEAIEEFARVRSRYLDGPAIFHSRYGTHGTNTIDNVHPFYVGEDRRTVIAHNGVLPSNVQPRHGDKRSDTRIAAEDLIPSVGPLHTRRVRKAIESWMGSWNKIAIITVNPRYRERGYLLNEDAGHWVNGVWYSNDGYRTTYASRGRKTSSGWSYSSYAEDDKKAKRTREDYTWDECGVCRGLVDYNEDACPYCGYCLMCESSAELCLCFHGGKSVGAGKGSTATEADDPVYADGDPEAGDPAWMAELREAVRLQAAGKLLGSLEGSGTTAWTAPAQILPAADGSVAAYDPQTGKESWTPTAPWASDGEETEADHETGKFDRVPSAVGGGWSID